MKRYTQNRYIWWLLPLSFIFLALINPVIYDINTHKYIRKSFDETIREPFGRNYEENAWMYYKKAHKDAISNLMLVRPVKQQSALPSFHLTVPQNTLVKMREAIKFAEYRSAKEATEAKPYFNAIFNDGSSKKNYPCKIKLRGYSEWHHQMEKPSLRVKFKKTNHYNGERHVELQKPEDLLALKNYLADYLAKEIGILCENIQHVRLFINNKYYGVYLKTMRQGERLTVEQKKMPGSFFKGERYHHFKWRDIKYWDTHGDDTLYSRKVFTRFLNALKSVNNVNITHETAQQCLEELYHVFDKDQYAKWAALMIAVGSVHTDVNHNHSYYLSSNEGKLQALVWDSNSFGIHYDAQTSHPDAVLHPLMDLIIRDPRWRHQRNIYLNEYLKHNCHPDRLNKMVDDLMIKLRPELSANTNHFALKFTYNEYDDTRPKAIHEIDDSIKDIKKYITERYKALTYYLDQCYVSALPHPDNAKWTQVVAYGNSSATVRGELSDTIVHPGLSTKLFKFGNKKFEVFSPPAPLFYTIKEPIEALRFFNAVTQKEIRASRKKLNDIMTRTVPPQNFKEFSSKTVTLGPGSLTLSKDLFVEKNETLVIKAGTHIKLKKGVGIYVKGRAFLKGSAQNPITLKNYSKEPWACVGISGKHSKGSIISHVHVEGGSSGQNGTLKFKGMFNVYNCPHVTVKHCRFGRNFISDDTLNIASSHAIVSHCVWENAHSDAFDMDICTGTVSHCEFLSSGNDGLDMMTCNVVVKNCFFNNSQDKGISVGENTKVTIENCIINNCQFGIQVKDQSLAKVVNCIFENNHTAIHLYQKKEIFKSGGHVRVERSSFTRRPGKDHDIWCSKESTAVADNKNIVIYFQGTKKAE